MVGMWAFLYQFWVFKILHKLKEMKELVPILKWKYGIQTREERLTASQSRVKHIRKIQESTHHFFCPILLTPLNDMEFWLCVDPHRIQLFLLTILESNTAPLMEYSFFSYKERSQVWPHQDFFHSHDFKSPPKPAPSPCWGCLYGLISKLSSKSNIMKVWTSRL